MELVYALVLAATALAMIPLVMKLYRRLRRAAGMGHVAKRMGLAFEIIGEPFPENDPAARTHLMRHEGGIVRNVMRGSQSGLEAVLFDFRYYRQSGQRASRLRRQTVAAFRFPGERFPHFQLQPENFILKIALRMEEEDINFDSQPEFSRRYLLRGPDAPAVRAFFTHERLAFLESVPERREMWMEGAGEWLLVYRENQLVKPSELPRFLREAGEMASGLMASAARKSA